LSSSSLSSGPGPGHGFPFIPGCFVARTAVIEGAGEAGGVMDWLSDDSAVTLTSVVTVPYDPCPDGAYEKKKASARS